MQLAPLALVLALLLPRAAMAQFAWDVMPPTVRGASLGGAVVFSGQAPSLSLANPAAAGWVSGADAGWRRTPGDGTYAWSSVEGGGAVLSLRHQSGPIVPTALALGLSTAKEIFSVDVGVSVSYVEQTTGSSPERSARLGVGVLRRLGPVDIGASVLGLSIPSDSGLPERATWRVNASTRSVEVGPLDLLFAGRLQGVDGELQGGSGFQIAYWPVVGRTFRVLVGHGHDPFTEEVAVSLGASVTLDALTLEWSALDSESAVLHSFGIRWR
ncbi:MAG: hypothetical protein HKN29_15735 [Rhodothermales bacterium]|nr:hypothetical protein [Rhodothermales bacterium]